MKPFERLAVAHTPNGTRLELCRHDGSYVIRADGIELMSTRRHQSEDRLAAIVCEPLAQASSPCVLIGGLGLGFTLRAALQHLPADARVVVAELVPEVIAWNAEPAFGLSHEAMADSRVEVVRADVNDVLRSRPGAFDGIMLDTDNGPDGLLMTENRPLYAASGVALTVAALRPGGRIAYWSVGEDRAFVGALQRGGLTVESERVRAHRSNGPMHVLYVATPRVVTARV